MAQCEWRERPGANILCPVLPDEGKKLCPRHVAMQEHRDAMQLERERAALVKRKALSSVRPNNRRSLLEQGYQPVGNNECRKCGKPIEWFRTKNGNNAPFDPMPDLDSPARSHFATCTHAAEFRKAS